jgi:hypothetical protein
VIELFNGAGEADERVSDTAVGRLLLLPGKAAVSIQIAAPENERHPLAGDAQDAPLAVEAAVHDGRC